MESLKEIGIKMLCDFGKFGVGKSLVLGLYDFPVPEKMKAAVNNKNIEKDSDRS